MVKAGRLRQLPLLNLPPLRKEHGGTIALGRRKLARPVDPKRPLHLVLRSSRAKGSWSMLASPHRKRVEHLTKTLAPKFGIKIYRFANVGNHLHLVVKCQTHEGFKGFLRLLAGKIALTITHAKKGQPKGKFWDTLAYSRLIEWGKEFETVKTYIVKNLFESMGAKRDAMRVFDSDKLIAELEHSRSKDQIYPVK